MKKEKESHSDIAVVKPLEGLLADALVEALEQAVVRMDHRQFLLRVLGGDLTQKLHTNHTSSDNDDLIRLLHLQSVLSEGLHAEGLYELRGIAGIHIDEL